MTSMRRVCAGLGPGLSQIYAGQELNGSWESACYPGRSGRWGRFSGRKVTRPTSTSITLHGPADGLGGSELGSSRCEMMRVWTEARQGNGQKGEMESSSAGRIARNCVG